MIKQIHSFSNNDTRSNFCTHTGEAFWHLVQHLKSSVTITSRFLAPFGAGFGGGGGGGGGGGARVTPKLHSLPTFGVPTSDLEWQPPARLPIWGGGVKTYIVWV